jgi:hypothetical protein
MIIRKGTHSSFRIPVVTMDTEVAYKVAFMPSCRYDIGPEQADINKLFGLGYMPHHHDNSVRFGWRYHKEVDMVEVLAYWYDNGKRAWASMFFTAIGQESVYRIRKQGDIHILEARHNTMRVPVCPRRIGYLLRPYFGGNSTAPHDIHINMQRI